MMTTKVRGILVLDGVETPMNVCRVMLRILDDCTMVGGHQSQGCWPRSPPMWRDGDAGRFPL